MLFIHVNDFLMMSYFWQGLKHSGDGLSDSANGGGKSFGKRGRPMQKNSSGGRLIIKNRMTSKAMFDTETEVTYEALFALAKEQ